MRNPSVVVKLLTYLDNLAPKYGGGLTVEVIPFPDKSNINRGNSSLSHEKCASQPVKWLRSVNMRSVKVIFNREFRVD